MRLGEALVELKEILEKDYGLAHVEFRDDLEYKEDLWIPGLTFNIRDQNQIPRVETLFTQVRREVITGYSPNQVACYLIRGEGKRSSYREVHVNIKQGDLYGVANDLVAKLTQNLRKRAAVKDGAKKENL